MRIVLGFLSGVAGMFAGWFGLASLVIALAGPDRDGGLAMGAFFNIGPLGALIGFGVGVWLFVKFGLVAQSAPFATESSGEPASASAVAVTIAPGTARISRPFAIVAVAIAGGLAWWAWYEFIRSPYLTHGYMTLALQFRLPRDLEAPAEAKDVQIFLEEGEQRWPAYLNEAGWRGHLGNRAVILAGVSMMYKTRRRVVALSIPGAPSQSWKLELSSDPDPTPGYTDWLPSREAPNTIELSYRLTVDR